MPDRDGDIDSIARPLIAQCRREIDAAWQQLEAAKEPLRRSRGQFERWRAQSRALLAAADEPAPTTGKDMRLGHKPRRRRRRRQHASATPSLSRRRRRHIPPLSASG